MSLVAHFRELHRHRVLIDCLVRREVAARYRRSVLGFVWSLLNPLLLLAIYALVFSRFTHAVTLPHYGVFLFVGILPWLWLSSSLLIGTTSIAQGGDLVARVCIPPQVLPAVAVLANFVHFALALPVAFLATLAVGIPPGAALILLPFVVLIETAFLYGAALFTATLAVRYRDIQFVVQNLVLGWFFLTPVAYPLDQVPDPYRAWVALNPATSLLRPYQRVLYEGRWPEPATLLVAALWAIAALALGVLVFEAMRGTLVEEI